VGGNRHVRTEPARDGRSTTFETGLDDPANASLILLAGNVARIPSPFASPVPVWVRDIRQVIEDAIARAQPTDVKLRHISAVTNRAVGGC
jgi:hypothetical protein